MASPGQLSCKKITPQGPAAITEEVARLAFV